jgi:hypothetical protein
VPIEEEEEEDEVFTVTFDTKLRTGIEYRTDLL